MNDEIRMIVRKVGEHGHRNDLLKQIIKPKRNERASHHGRTKRMKDTDDQLREVVA